MSKALKRSVCMLLSLMLTAVCICVMPVSAGKTMSGDIFFETDFEDFAGLVDSEARRWYFVDKTYGTDAWTTNSTINEVAEADGNVAMSITNTATTDEEAEQQKVQLRFTLNTADNITREGGKLYIAYDAEAAETSKQSYWRYTSVDEGEGTSTKYLFYMDYPQGKFYANNDDFYQWGNKGNSKPLILGTRYSVEQVIDFDNKMYYSFVNGEALTPVSIENVNENIGVLEFLIKGDLKFLDNLKVAYMKPESFKVTAEKIADNQFELSFTEGVKYTEGVSCLVDNISVVNENRAAEITNIEMKSSRRAVLTLGTNIGDRYSISLNNVENCVGTPLSNPAINHIGAKLMWSHNGDTVTGAEGKWNGVVAAVDDETAEDGKAIKFTHDVSESENLLQMFLGDYIYMEGDLEVEYRMKLNDKTGSTVMSLGEWNNVSANRINGIFIDGAAKQPYYCNISTELTGNATSLHGNWGKIDCENYHTYKTVYHFDEQTADFYIDGELKAEGLLINNYDTAKDAKAVRYLNFFTKQASDATAETPSEVCFDYVKVSQVIKAPYLKSAYVVDGDSKYEILENAENIPVTAEKLELTFGGNIWAQWATVDKIFVEAHGKEVEGTTFAYDKLNRVCTVTFANDLDFNTKYGITLRFIDWHATHVTPSWIYFNTAKKYELKDVTMLRNDVAATEAELTAGDMVELEATMVNNSGAEKDVTVILAAYENGAMVAAGVANKTVISGENPIYVYLTLPNTGSAFEIRAYVWSGDGSLTPLMDAIDFE